MLKLLVPGLKSDIGLGDLVKQIADKLHINLNNCGCAERQQWLNERIQLVPMRIRGHVS